MIILDTNVVSEPISPNPNPAIIQWLGSLSGEVAITAITAAELLAGIYKLPEGKKKQGLQLRISAILDAYERAGSILPFNENCVEAYAQFTVYRKRVGRPVHPFDAFIAAIAVSNNAILATRNVKDFEGIATQLINPWESN